MTRRATILLAALGVLAAAAPADAQSRRTTLGVSVRVVRAPAPAVSTAETTQLTTPAAPAPSQAAPGQPEPMARTEEAGVPQPGLLRATTEPGTESAPVAVLPGFRTVTINY